MKWNQQLLEPVIITYNRAQNLQKTLQMFFDSGFSASNFHVLDNASTDNTAEIVTTFQKQWPGLKYHCNTYNIGGNANILRALEISNSFYFWVIGDDDEWYLQDLDELKTALNLEPDVIRLGWLTSPFSQTKEIVDAKTLIQDEPLFLISLTMISATIIRRTLFAEYLRYAYLNTGDAFPQIVPLLMKLNTSSFSVYNLSQPIMSHVPSKEPGYYFGDLEWYAAWYRTTRFLDDKKLRATAIKNITAYMIRPKTSTLKQTFWLLKVALYYKSFNVNQGKYLLLMLTYGTGWRWNILFVSLIYLLIPKWVAHSLRKLLFGLRKRPKKNLQYDRSRL